MRDFLGLDLFSLEFDGLGLHIDELVEGAMSVSRGCLTRIEALWLGPSGASGAGPGACMSSVVVDVAFLALLVIAVIAVVRIRQRGEEGRLELARQMVARGLEPPPELFPTSAQGDLRRGIVLIFSGLGLLGASIGVAGLGPAGLVPGFIGLGYLVSYLFAARRKKVP